MSTWVLILTPNDQHRHPAIIGGYRSAEQAEAAGNEAMMSPQDKALRKMTAEERVEWYNKGGSFSWSPTWVSYTVIPGAAAL